MMTNQYHNDQPLIYISFAFFAGPIAERLWLEIDGTRIEESTFWYQFTPLSAVPPQFSFQRPDTGDNCRSLATGEQEQRLAAGLLAALTGIKTGAIPSGQCGFDGSDYELQIGTAHSHLTYHWWDELPRQWKGLKPAVKLLHGYLWQLREQRRHG